MPDPTPSSDRRRKLLGWLLAPLLATAAVIVQLAIDVPHHPMIPRDDGEAKVKKTSATRTRKRWRDRGEAYTDRLRETWSARPLTDEPIEPRFRAYHEALLRDVVRKAEADLGPGRETGYVEARPNCHTIRCALELCGAREDVDGVAERLPRFEIAGGSLWRELVEIEPERRMPKLGDRACRRWIVDFAVEGPDARKLVLDG